MCRHSALCMHDSSFLMHLRTNTILTWTKRCKSMHLVFGMNFDDACDACVCAVEEVEKHNRRAHAMRKSLKVTLGEVGTSWVMSPSFETNPRISSCKQVMTLGGIAASALRLFLLPASRMQRVYSPLCSLLRGNALSDETLSSLVCSVLYYFIVILKSRQHLCACLFELCEC